LRNGLEEKVEHDCDDPSDLGDRDPAKGYFRNAGSKFIVPFPYATISAKVPTQRTMKVAVNASASQVRRSLILFDIMKTAEKTVTMMRVTDSNA
jgi:hypothetical protein